MLATVLTCVVIGLLSAVEVYVAQLICPRRRLSRMSITAYVHVVGRAWGPLFAVVGFTLLLANFGSGMGAQLGAARLLYGMGPANALPKSFFGAVDDNITFRATMSFLSGNRVIGAFFLSYGLARKCQFLARSLAFMGVYAAAFIRYFVRAKKRSLESHPAFGGFFHLFGMWLNLSRPAMIVGSM